MPTSTPLVRPPDVSGRTSTYFRRTATAYTSTCPPIGSAATARNVRAG
jgi:hypothetical protein